MKILNKLVIIVLAITTFSCNDDYLEKIPLGSPADNNYMQTEAEMKAALNAAYRGLYHHMGQYSNSAWHGLDFGTDIGIRRPSGTYPYPWVYGGQNSEYGKITSLWKNLYKHINRANYVIQNISRGQDAVSEQTYNEILGQAKFLRAFYYFYLYELWGDVPLVTSIPVDYNEFYYYTRTPKDQVIDTIHADLDFAIDNLPQTWAEENYGRITSAAAGALKTRVALFNGDYSGAISAAEVVMGYGINLYSDYQKLFLTEGAQSPENLLIVQYVDGVETHSYPRDNGGRNNGGWAINQPTRYLVDSYECTDGQKIDVSPLYNPDSPYENRDPRLAATVLTSGTWFCNWLFDFYQEKTQRIVNGEIKTVNNRDYDFKNVQSKTGYLIRKNFDENDYFNGTMAKSVTPVVVMRYVEVLLSYAEAKFEVGEFDQAVCDATINVIRKRVGMPDKTVAGMTDTQIRSMIRNERKVELAFEGLRYFDIRRWKTIEHVLNNDRVIGRYAPEYVTKIQNGEPTNFPRPTFDEYGISHYPNEEDVFVPLETQFVFDPAKDYLWPIPQEELDNAKVEFPNNPGY